MEEISARTKGARQQVVTVTGGPGQTGPPSINACEGRSPHGFVDQEAEVVAGIARFVRGGHYYGRLQIIMRNGKGGKGNLTQIKAATLILR
jgi:hypothetical protein